MAQNGQSSLTPPNKRPPKIQGLKVGTPEPKKANHEDDSILSVFSSLSLSVYLSLSLSFSFSDHEFGSDVSHEMQWYSKRVFSFECATENNFCIKVYTHYVGTHTSHVYIGINR